MTVKKTAGKKSTTKSKTRKKTSKLPSVKRKERARVLVYTSPSKQSYVRLGRCGGTTKGGEKWPPIKLIYLTGAARQEADTLFIDADAEELSGKEFMTRVLKFKPDYLVLEPTPPSLTNELRVVARIKKRFPEVETIFTGAFASAEPKMLLEKFKEIDMIIVGEAEQTLMDFLKKQDKKTKGLWYKEKGKAKYTGQRIFLEDLD